MPVIKVYEAPIWMNGHASGRLYSFYPIPQVLPPWSEPGFGQGGTEERPRFWVVSNEVHEVVAPEGAYVAESDTTPKSEPRCFGLKALDGWVVPHLDAESFINAARDGAFGLSVKQDDVPQEVAAVVANGTQSLPEFEEEPA